MLLAKNSSVLHASIAVVLFCNSCLNIVSSMSMPSFLFLPVYLLRIQRFQSAFFIQFHNLFFHPVDLFIALLQDIHSLTVCRKRILQRDILCFQLFDQLLQFGKILFQTALFLFFCRFSFFPADTLFVPAFYIKSVSVRLPLSNI